MSSTEQEIRALMVTALAGLTGMSADKVRVGRPKTMTEGSLPQVWLAVGSMRDTFGKELTSYTRTLTFDLVISVAAADSTEEAQEDALFSMLTEVCDAIRAIDHDKLWSAPLAAAEVEPALAGPTGLPSLIASAVFEYYMPAPGMS